MFIERRTHCCYALVGKGIACRRVTDNRRRSNLHLHVCRNIRQHNSVCGHRVLVPPVPFLDAKVLKRLVGIVRAINDTVL